MSDRKDLDPAADSPKEGGDAAERAERLTEDIDKLEKEAIPPKTKPPGVGAML